MRARTLCTAALTVAAIMVGGSAEASALPSESSLVITAYDSADGDWRVIAEATLKCAPTGGNHLSAEDACDILTEVDGEFEALPTVPVVCVLIYQPVIIEVGGNWRDRVVRFDREYPNLCVAGAESGGVFRFDPAKHS
jgi:hypothetical protein